jgi:hypothetical protein
VLTVAAGLPQLFVARRIEPRSHKKPFLLLAIYLRVVSWAVLAGLVALLGASHPQMLAWALVGLLAVFYAGGGLVQNQIRCLEMWYNHWHEKTNLCARTSTQ